MIRNRINKVVFHFRCMATLKMKIFVRLRHIIVMVYSSCKYVCQCIYHRLNDSRLLGMTRARPCLDPNFRTINKFEKSYSAPFRAAGRSTRLPFHAALLNTWFLSSDHNQRFVEITFEYFIQN